MKTDDPNWLVRYTPNERTNHWITAIAFVLLALSGLALFHPSMFWLTAIFGGGQWTPILHPLVGVVMFVAFLVLAVRFWHHNLLASSDIQWLEQTCDSRATRAETVPQTG